jgi:general secretion pathway protein B
MSYVLEALRRAAHEREHGQVPGLHSQQGYRQPVDGSNADSDFEEESDRDAGAPGRNPWLLWGAVALALSLVGLIAWVGALAWAPAALPMSPTAPHPVAVMQASSPQTPPINTEPEIQGWPELNRTAPARPQAPAATAAPLRSSTSLVPDAEDAPRRSSTSTTSRTPDSAPNLDASSPKPQSSSGETTSLPSWNQLPAAIQRELPPLSAGGAMVSEDPSSRIVIINGQVFREGDSIAPSLKLETIRHRSAILSWRGTRFEWAY